MPEQYRAQSLAFDYISPLRQSATTVKIYTDTRDILLFFSCSKGNIDREEESRH